MKFTASSEKLLEERIPGVKVPPGHWMGSGERAELRLRFLLLLHRVQIPGRGTDRSRAWVGDFAGVFRPLVVVTMFVSKRPVEDVPDVGHGVHADGRALENGALDKHTRVKHPGSQSLCSTQGLHQQHG